MKRLVVIIVLALVAGCATIERRPLRTKLPGSIALAAPVKVYGAGLSKYEWVELPAGNYFYRFTKDGSRYYMREDPLIRIRTLSPERSAPGGLVYWRDTGRFHVFAEQPWWKVFGVYPNGKKIELVPFTMQVIPDEVLSLCKDEANQTLHPTHP